MARVLKGSQFYLHTLTFIRNRNESYRPLPTVIPPISGFSLTSLFFLEVISRYSRGLLVRDFSCRLHARPVTQFTGLKRRRKITEIQSGIKSLKTQQNKQIGTKTRNSMGLLTLTQYPDYRERQTSWRVVCHYAAVTVRRWRGGGVTDVSFGPGIQGFAVLPPAPPVGSACTLVHANMDIHHCPWIIGRTWTIS